MVDVFIGELVWFVSKVVSNVGQVYILVGSMDWVVFGGVLVVDFDFDGFVDYLYFVDFGGQVFCVNLDNGNDGVSGLVMGVICLVVLGGIGIVNYCCFYEVFVVGYKFQGGVEVFYVLIGLGYWVYLLDEGIDEVIFLICDEGFCQIGGEDGFIIYLDLRLVGFEFDGEDKGWYYEFFCDGEKVLLFLVIFDNIVFFIIYVLGGEDFDDDFCVVCYGEVYLYVVDMVIGQLLVDSDNNSFDDNIVIKDIDWDGEKFDQSIILFSLLLIFQEGGKKVFVVVGMEVVDVFNVNFINL